MIKLRLASPAATAQLLAAASCSLLEVLSSVTQLAAACSVSSRCCRASNYSSSATQQQQQPGQQHKRVRDGPGLQDFIRASSPLGTSFASQSSSNTSSHGPAPEPGASLSKSVFVETYGELAALDNKPTAGSANLPCVCETVLSLGPLPNCCSASRGCTVCSSVCWLVDAVGKQGAALPAGHKFRPPV
jgi:hypothetical protein